MDEKNFINKEKLKKEMDDYKKFLFSSNLFSMAITLISAQTVQKFVRNNIYAFYKLYNKLNWRKLEESNIHTSHRNGNRTW